MEYLYKLAEENALNEQGHIKLINADILDKAVWEFTEYKPFDLIIINDVFEHIYNSTTFFKRIREFSGNYTVVYFAVPNGDSWQSIEKEGHKFIFGLTLLEPGVWSEIVGSFNIYYRPLDFYQLHFQDIGFPHLYLIVDEHLIQTAPKRVQKKFAKLGQKIKSNPFKSKFLNDKAKHQFQLLQQKLSEDLKENNPLKIHLSYDQHFWEGFAIQTINPELEKDENLIHVTSVPRKPVHGEKYKR